MTMFPIASITVSSNTNAVFSFTSIPQIYTHLHLRLSARNYGSGTQAFLYLLFNGDSGSNRYYNHYFYGNTSQALQSNGANQSTASFTFTPAGGSLASVYNGAVMDILDYSNTSKYKTLRSFQGFDDNNTSTTNASIGLSSSGYYFTTAAITSLDVGIFNPSGSGIAAGSRFDLYGSTVSSVTGA